MSQTTAIEWCDSTFNPWIGCTKVSPACDHCYAAVSTPARTMGIAWGAGQPRRRTSPANWRQPLAWNAQAAAFFAEHGRRRRVFCSSLADVFDNEVPGSWRIDLFNLIRATPDLDWLLLSKRIGNVTRMLDDAGGWSGATVESGARQPLPNVWLGATICNQAEADRDIPKLLGVPARIRFLSIEPLLGPVNFHCSGCGRIAGDHHAPDQGGCMGYFPDWVILGGESGPRARPMHPGWARSLRDQCTAAGIPFLFKQWGEFAPNARFMDEVARSDRKLMPVAEFPGRPIPAALMDRVGKKAAGRTLDGAVHDGFPEAA